MEDSSTVSCSKNVAAITLSVLESCIDQGASSHSRVSLGNTPAELSQFYFKTLQCFGPKMQNVHTRTVREYCMTFMD